MLTLSPSVRIYLSPGVTDMRKSFDTLAALVRDRCGEDPLSGSLFVFCNRNRDRLKILYWDRSGYVLFAKRLEKGTFSWPKPTRTTKIEMTAAELSMLVGGLDPGASRKRKWIDYRAPESSRRRA